MKSEVKQAQKAEDEKEAKILLNKLDDNLGQIRFIRDELSQFVDDVYPYGSPRVEEKSDEPDPVGFLENAQYLINKQSKVADELEELMVHLRKFA